MRKINNSTKKDLITLLGFTLLFLGMLSIILGTVGVQFVFLKFLDEISLTFGFLVKLCFIIIGLILIIFTKFTKKNN